MASEGMLENGGSYIPRREGETLVFVPRQQPTFGGSEPSGHLLEILGVSTIGEYFTLI